MTYFKKRVVSYTIITILIFLLPFLRINGNHFFLLSFDKQKLNLFFVSFNTNELYLMPFLLIMLFVFIFFITNLLGRVWCAWGCPQTIFRVIYRDLIQTKIFHLFSNRKNKQAKERDKVVSKILSVIIFYLISLVAASNFMWYFIPPEDYFAYLKNFDEHLITFGFVFFVSAFMTFDITFIKENFCAYLCPYARIQSVLFDNDTKLVIYDESRGGVIYKDNERITKKPIGEECICCEACVKICPTHIDIRKGMQLDCINCLECADACASVQERFNRPSLISWASTKAIKTKTKTKYIRAKSIAYSVVLCGVFCMLMYMASTKETMLLNINRTTELYTISKDLKYIENTYTMLFHNTDNKDHEFYLEVLGNDSISIQRPKESFIVGAGKKVKKIVILKSPVRKLDEQLNEKIIIKSYALDDSNIFTTKETFFIFPKDINAK